MSNLEIFITNPISISSRSFYPRNYNPNYLLVQNGMKNNPMLSNYVAQKVTGGSTPPAHFFYDNHGIPFIKTSAVSRHFININDLYLIDANYHKKQLKRSITKPYDIIFTMTGKFMGKAAMCPPIIEEMNMSQNSVVLHTNTPEEAAFLTIFLNSQANRIQIRGTYSITKQKFLNQDKISSLRVIPFDSKQLDLMRQYLYSFNSYYSCMARIKKIIAEFNDEYQLSYVDEAQVGFSVKPNAFDRTILTPNFYREDICDTINRVKSQGKFTYLDSQYISKGDEIGSAFYQEEGVPFIKTSDIMNYDFDHEPDCYCADHFLSLLNQDIKIGDIIFTKDGKPGEVAIVLEDSRAVISSGLVKYRPQSEQERYWVFLLLASKYGQAYFKKWFVTASTMTHLRADFLKDFKIPLVSTDIEKKYITPLKVAFLEKSNAYKNIVTIKKIVEATYIKKGL